MTDTINANTLNESEVESAGVVDATSANAPVAESIGDRSGSDNPTTGGSGPVYTQVPTVLGSSAISVGTTAVGLGTVPTGATHALAVVDGGDIRFWEDGTTNPNSVAAGGSESGMLVVSGNAVEFTNLASVKMIQTGASGPANVMVSFRKYV